MAEVKFEDYSQEAINMLDSEVNAWLHEAAGIIESEAVRNTKVGKVAGGNTKQKWKYIVDAFAKKATIGNTEQTAIWLELGTGDHALNGDGRKGGWYIPIGDGPNQISQEVVDAYHFKTVTGKDGVRFAFTTGMKPRRILHNAAEKSKKRIQNLFKAKLKKLGE